MITGKRISTYQERKEECTAVLNSAVITLGEIVSVAYHWWQFESALIKRDAAIKKARKHAKRYNEKVSIIEFREELDRLK